MSNLALLGIYYSPLVHSSQISIPECSTPLSRPSTPYPNQSLSHTTTITMMIVSPCQQALVQTVMTLPGGVVDRLQETKARLPLLERLLQNVKLPWRRRIAELRNVSENARKPKFKILAPSLKTWTRSFKTYAWKTTI